jgi:hypothetical protein
VTADVSVMKETADRNCGHHCSCCTLLTHSYNDEYIIRKAAGGIFCLQPVARSATATCGRAGVRAWAQGGGSAGCVLLTVPLLLAFYLPVCRICI